MAMTKQERVNYYLQEIDKLKLQIEKEEAKYKIVNFMDEKTIEMCGLVTEIFKDEPDFFKNKKEFEDSIVNGGKLLTLTLRVEDFNGLY